jgi:hypothetical protein
MLNYVFSLFKLSFGEYYEEGEKEGTCKSRLMTLELSYEKTCVTYSDCSGYKIELCGSEL